MASRRNLQSVAINSASSGNVTIIANPSTTVFMYIWALSIVFGGATTATLYNGAGALTGGMQMLANGAIDDPDNGVSPLYTIDPGASFIINDSAGVQKSGYCKYSN